MRRAAKEIWDLVTPITNSMGYEFIGAEFGQAENGMTLRVYIDGENGVLVDDCAKVSRQLSALLDVEDLISGEYCLEVSSPGVNRPLFSVEQFEAQVGKDLKIKMQRPVKSRRNFKGQLKAVESEAIEVEIDGELFKLAVKDIEQARLVYGF